MNRSPSPTAHRFRELVDRAGEIAQWREIVEAIRCRQQRTIGRCIDSAGAWLVAALQAQLPGLTLVVTSEQDEIDAWLEDLAVFGVTASLPFPAWEVPPAERSPLDTVFSQRLSTLRRLSAMSGTASRVVVASAASLLQPVPAPERLQAASRTLTVGDRVDPDELLGWLSRHGFHATPAVAMPGEFAMRGGIVDIFPLDTDHPVRLEWFDVELESIRVFEEATQRSIERVDTVVLAAWDPSAEESSTVFDYLGEQCRVVIADYPELASRWDRIARQDSEEMGWLPPARVAREIQSRAALECVPLGQETPHGIALPIESVERFTGEVGRVRVELEQAAEQHHVWLFAETEAEARRLHELLAESRALAEGHVDIAVGRIRGGFRLGPLNEVVLSAAQIFRRTQVRRVSRAHHARPLDDYLDLRPGQLVVHLGHGIARYHGLKLLEKHGRSEEHLELEFRGGTRLYVPASQIELVQKYVGGTKRAPTLSAVGGTQWERQKQAAAEAVEDLAAEMLELQAARTLRPGLMHDPDSEWQCEFDASFPYAETEDQLRAIEDVKRDMESPNPMDRLLCGDVGFGKTEVAMRAAFKAVESGYQVAILVPTTVLAEQHFQSFRQRMSEFPIDIARLSRFCSTTETREILEGLRRGSIDIVIGTHRLASRDVAFHNLGLVMIDEEQRFGVKIKERLKTLTPNVDVLTMTATPIPRTLHMALVGVRDISTLHTPPEDRMAVETRVVGFDENLIRQAVLRELNRGGQVFFVHNRIEDIYPLEQRLQRIVPEARIGVGHGRLPEHELERVMLAFIEHRFDVLLATTIVESGLDIPNANTIFIDEADRYGLADLHQLRGRVGRYKHRAFCYLLVDPAKYLTPNAARRLRAIEEYSELGAGFQLAMRDLEIRGAGNLLGTQQSGHIAAVGYELYCQLLEAAVRRLKQLPAPQRLDVQIQLPGDAYIPAHYVGDMQLKMDLYRRMARLTDIESIERMREELRDRFGPVPGPVERLLLLAELRIDAAIWQIEAIWIEQEKYLGMRYGDRQRIETLVRRRNGKARIVDSRSVYATLPDDVTDSTELVQWVKSMLHPER